MQTVVWIAYSDSAHFSDKNSYKILCILSYSLEVMNLASSNICRNVLKKTETGLNLSPRGVG
jgi:hypothetical protein